MSKKHASGLRRGARIGSVAAAAAIALGFLSAGAANADTFVPLPDGEIADPVGNVIKRTAESALVSPSLAGTGAGRVAWVSGTVTVDVANIKLPTEAGKSDGSTSSLQGTNNSSTHKVSRINTGYIVGCQVDISGLKGNLGINFNLGGAGTMTGNLVTDAVTGMTSVVTNAVSPSASLSVPLQPGQVRFVHIDGKDITKPSTTYSIQYQDAELSQQGCGGAAQARAYTVLEIVGNDYVKTSLYGQPFSIG